jgi:hypothetical protein
MHTMARSEKLKMQLFLGTMESRNVEVIYAKEKGKLPKRGHSVSRIV